jgi:hypothetical protein
MTTDQKGAIAEGNRGGVHRGGKERLEEDDLTADEVDLIAAYSAHDRCFPIPIERVEKRPTIELRVDPTLNSQKRRANWADDFDFEARLRRHQGAVAQLGER